MSLRNMRLRQEQPLSSHDLASAIRQIRAWLTASTHVLIGAGAGLSAAAGIDYTDQVNFAQVFPALMRRGFRARYELIGYTDWTPAEEWGYWATHIHDVRFTQRSHPVYSQLLELVEDKNYFVLTSNVDAMFARNGFDERRVFAPQGDYATMHCSKPCSYDTWPSKPIIDRILPTIDPTTLTVTDPSVIPHCPRCGGPVFMNVRLDSSFSEEPYEEQRKRLNDWLQDARNEPLLAIEIGAGFNTPSVVRWPMEQIVSAIPQAQFLRINLTHPAVPVEIADKSIGLAVDAGTAIAAIRQEL
jgi:NAD-dependent SIR2 family protein deacetylase